MLVSIALVPLLLIAVLYSLTLPRDEAARCFGLRGPPSEEISRPAGDGGDDD